jgi:peptidoglycan/LPS O-acetylase OafA/YrhL
MATEVHPTQIQLGESTLGRRDRDFYIDCLRSVMIALVILQHTAITYGAAGLWFYRELDFSATLSSVILTVFNSTNQAYFMGILFLLAGYFTPASLERKGFGRFLCDRFLRLGLPLLVFGLLLGPITIAMAKTTKGHEFWPTLVQIWNQREFIPGPLWFLQALLMFSLVYCGWRAWLGAPITGAQRSPRPVPGYRWWLLSAAGVGAAALAIRQVFPTGVEVFGLQLGFFASYIFLFCLGIAAWRYDWLRQLQWQNARPWIRSLPFIWLPMAVTVTVTVLLNSSNAPGKNGGPGGLSWTAIVYAFWEPFIAWGLIAAWLLVFRRYMNEPSAIWTWLNRRSYAVYIVHTVVLVGISLLFRGWAAPALFKFAVIGTLACIASWILVDPLVRVPGVRQIV